MTSHMGPPPKFRGAPRYHNTRSLYMTDEGVDYDVHDFSTAELGLKLGGFMLLMAGVDDDTAQEELLSDDDDDMPHEDESVDVDMTEGIKESY